MYYEFNCATKRAPHGHVENSFGFTFTNSPLYLTISACPDEEQVFSQNQCCHFVTFVTNLLFCNRSCYDVTLFDDLLRSEEMFFIQNLEFFLISATAKAVSSARYRIRAYELL